MRKIYNLCREKEVELIDLVWWEQIILLYGLLALLNVPFWLSFLYHGARDEGEGIWEFLWSCRPIYQYVLFFLVWPIWWGLALFVSLYRRDWSFSRILGIGLGHESSVRWADRLGLFGR